MEERSASDREGVGSTPTSGSVVANPGYAAAQLAKALTTANEHPDAETRERAERKADTWRSVFTQMLEGSLRVGSRAPLDDVPPWVTLEVATGGFATGRLMAGGPLLEHERSLASECGLAADEHDRLSLNCYFLSDDGLSGLLARLRDGTYEIAVPEEGALLVVAWLTHHGYGEEARDLLNHIAPFFSRLRFYPQPSECPQRFTSRVFLQDVDTALRSLRAIQPNQAIAAQKEAIEVWTPLYDELIGLFLETVDGLPPNLAVGPDCVRLPRENGKFNIEGGWPCSLFPEDWFSRAADLLRRCELQRSEHNLGSKPRHRKSSLAQLLPLLQTCVASRGMLPPRETGKIRLMLARYVARRGLPGSATCRSVREQQAHQAQTPMYHRVAAALVPRLLPYPGKEGIEDLSQVTQPITEDESLICGLAPGHELPETIRHKIERCLCDTIDALVERGLITSGDVVAQVLPQVSSGWRVAGLNEPLLRQLYAAIYRAFRRRRSLLLFDLQSQVKMEELPWVAAIEQFRSENLLTHECARLTLEEIVSLPLIYFPQAILPNKLLQELRALVEAARLDIPVIDELAADIFIGRFSAKFAQAAKQAAELMAGTLYQIYFGIDYDEVARLARPQEETPSKPLYPSLRSPDDFAKLCCARAGVSHRLGSPAANGMIIEQQQIVTTQNLATLFAGLGLRQTLRPHLASMARRCFEWICRRQQANAPDWHGRLIMIKNTAYAWRQMLFFLSFVAADELDDFVAWARQTMANQPDSFQVRFRPVFDGFIAASQGRTPPAADARSDDGRQFLGWSTSRHWLLE